MAYTHTRPIVPHTRESHARLDGKIIRLGSWGTMPNDCRVIEAYARKPGAVAGPLTIDHIPDSKGGIWKVFYENEFQRYADGEDVRTLSTLCRQNEHERVMDFISLPEVLMFSSKGQGDDLDDAFGIAPPKPKAPKKAPALTHPDEDDPFAEAIPGEDSAYFNDPFGVAPENDRSLEGWHNVIQQMGREHRAQGLNLHRAAPDPDGPFADVFEAEAEDPFAAIDDPLAGAFG